MEKKETSFSNNPLQQNHSPNKYNGRFGYNPEAIVLHICQGSYEGSLNWLKNPASKVSAHFLISDTSVISQLVECKNSAWHAGVVVNPTWPLLKQNVNPNFYTLGIELAGFSKDLPTLSKIVTVSRLIRALCNKFNIPVDLSHIIPHHAINANKTCPGPNINIPNIVYCASLPLDTSDMNFI